MFSLLKGNTYRVWIIDRIFAVPVSYFPFQLDGESWRSSVPKYPKNAASLMTPGLLTPEPVSNETPNNEVILHFHCLFFINNYFYATCK